MGMHVYALSLVYVIYMYMPQYYCQYVFFSFLYLLRKNQVVDEQGSHVIFFQVEFSGRLLQSLTLSIWSYVLQSFLAIIFFPPFFSCSDCKIFSVFFVLTYCIHFFFRAKFYSSYSSFNETYFWMMGRLFFFSFGCSNCKFSPFACSDIIIFLY